MRHSGRPAPRAREPGHLVPVLAARSRGFGLSLRVVVVPTHCPAEWGRTSADRRARQRGTKSMFVTEGPLDPESRLFVGRSAELTQMETWLISVRCVGAVLGARQTGKTSLLLKLRYLLGSK